MWSPLLEIEGLDPSMTINWDQLNCDIAERRAFKQLKLKVHPRHLGSDMYFEVSGHAVFERGEFLGYRGLAWDVTERESLIAKITDNEARFRALTELSSDWYWEMDEQLRFTRLQRGERDTINLEDDEIIGKHRWELPGELIRPSSWDEHRAVLLARKPFRDVLFRRWMPDGSFVYNVTSGDPIFDRTANSRYPRHRQEHHRAGEVAGAHRATGDGRRANAAFQQADV